jgi:diphosphomevalonate decarboxylase
MRKVVEWRSQGLQVCYTIDAGPNVHVLCPAEDAQSVEKLLQSINGIETIYRSNPGHGVQLS